jgi:anti-sigma regulatory factor (Ser/Thr protein kinase)
VATARRFVVDRLARDAVGRTIVEELTLAASELVTNAIEHGQLRPVVLEVGMTRDVVCLSVTSHSPDDDVAPVSQWAVAETNQIAGRGLGIVRALADDVSVSRGHGQLTITLERRLR